MVMAEGEAPEAPIPSKTRTAINIPSDGAKAPAKPAKATRPREIR
jgi:hypothetical protein